MPKNDISQYGFKKGFDSRRFGKGAKHSEETKKLLRMGAEGRKILAKRRNKKNNSRSSGKFLKIKYGITMQEYEELLKKQDYRCAICGSYNKTRERRLAVDHSHETGKVRGLLCGSCNVGIGSLKEDKQIFENAIEYLGLNK